MAKKKVKSNLDHQITYRAENIRKEIKELEKKIKKAKSAPKDSKLKEDEVSEEIEPSEEDISDFSIGDTILSSEPKKQNWQGENLEDVTGREGSNKANSYKSVKSQEPIHSAEVRLNDLYSSNERGGNVYDEASSSVYNEKSNLYEGGSDDQYLGHTGDNIKGYAEVEEDRRGGRSMLEISGFEDKEKQKERELRKAKY